MSIADSWNNELVEEFLNLNPRPTAEELMVVVHGEKIGFNSPTNQCKQKGYVQDPENLRKTKYDKDEFLRIIRLEGLNDGQ